MSLLNFFQKKKIDDAIAKLPDELNGNGDGRTPLIRLRKIVKTFKNPAGEFTVLKGVDANFYEGDFVGVIGKSGSGKSTLINMITGIDRPTSGEIYVEDTPVHKLNENNMATWRGRHLGIVFQFFQLLPTLTLLENIMLPMDFCNMYPSGQRKGRAMKLLEMVEMQDHAHKLPTAISGGQQQRVAIARALANDPPIIIADEPTGNLDSRTADAVFDMFEDLRKQGKTIVMVTHDIGLAKRVTRTMLVADGELVNEWVARALPNLTHQQMLQATHQLDAPLRFAPGQEIIRQGDPAEHFFIITEGQVEVMLKSPDGSELLVAHMGPGQYFGEIELFRNKQAIATVRAGQSTVTAVALDKNEFLALISESEATRLAVENMIAARERENRDAHRRIA